MASNGSVVAELNQVPGEGRAGITVTNSTPSPTKPEVARKPVPPGNKPRPPVPKKPPLAHKTPPPLAQKPHPHPAGNQGSPAQAPPSRTLPPVPNNHTPDGTASPTSSAGSTPVVPVAAQGALVSGDTGNSGPKPARGKCPPPLLPKAPPKGTPPPPAKKPKEPPPRPEHLPTPRKPGPPVPAKRPAGAKPRPALPPPNNSSPRKPDEDPGGPSGHTAPLPEPSHSYKQVVVEENPRIVAEKPEEKLTGLSLTKTVTPASSGGDSGSYQQVVVAENPDRKAAVAGVSGGGSSVNGKEGETVQSQTPRPYVNVDFKHGDSSQQTSSASDTPLRRYQQVVVEENLKRRSGACSVSVNSEESSGDHIGEVKKDNSLRPLSPSVNLLPEAGDSASNLTEPSSKATSLEVPQTVDADGDSLSLNLSAASQCHCDDSDFNTSIDSARSGGASEAKPLPDRTNESAENHTAQGPTADGEQHSVPTTGRRSPRTNPSKVRPSKPAPVPPPVRPKPKKRTSLLRQSVAAEDDEGSGTSSSDSQSLTQSQLTSSLGSLGTTQEDHAQEGHSQDSLGTSQEYHIQEALYQEIDELDLPSRKQGEHASSVSEAGHKDQNQAQSEETKPVESTVPSSIGEQQEAVTVTADDVKCSESEVAKDQTTHPETPEADQQIKLTVEGGDQKSTSGSPRKSPERQDVVSFQDVGETSFMLKEIEQLLNARLGSVDKEAGDTGSDITEGAESLTASQIEDTPVRPPRPRHAERLRRLTLDSVDYVDSSSTESLTSVGKKPPPKPKRKNLPGPVTRSASDTTGMKSYVDSLAKDDDNSEEEEAKPFLPPRQESLRLNQDPKPPPLPPRNKSMERIPSKGQLDDRRASAPAPASGPGPAKVVRSSSGSKPGKKHMPRPTRKAPPPPMQAPKRPLSMVPSSQQSSDSSSKEPSPGASSEKVPGYQKISNGSVSNPGSNNINTVVPKTAVLGSIDSPCSADVSSDHDYHEIPDHLVKELTLGANKEEESLSSSKSKEETPPPDLPPRGYKPPSSGQHDPSPEPGAGDSLHPPEKPGSGKKRSDSETGASSPQDGKPAEHLSGEESTSLSSPISSRPDSFSSEVMGSLLHIVGERPRPVSTHSSSSHSETGSGVEVPTFDHSSASESESEDDEEKQLKKVAQEVVESEKVFVDVLKLLNVDFRVFMSEKAEQAGHPIVPTETLNKILDFLPQLQSFNEMLLKDLTDRLANWEQTKKIADIFVKKGPFLKLYSSYIRNFENATALLEEACKKHGSFGMALQQFEMTPRCARLALKHYMLKPIQRIPQYKLLFQNYLKRLTPESPDYKDTLTALNIVSEVADHANESMRHGDTVQKLLEIQRSLIGQFEVIQPGRVLIKQGELMKLSRKEMQPRMFFLFSDVLLYTTPTNTGYRLNNILSLQGMKVVHPNSKLDEYKTEFNIISTQRSFTVAASSPEVTEEWLRALWNAIEENSERYHTFKAMQPEPKTSLLDKDFVLGTKAPLWVPDARVTMCMLCLAEFSITWRRHHCRACGRIICGRCSENKAPLRYLLYKPDRVCDECFEKLSTEVDKQLEQAEQKKQQQASGTSASSASTTAATTTSPTGTSASAPGTSAVADTMGLSFSSIKARFQKIRKSAREKRKSGLARPSVLKEVHANDEGSDMSGYLWVAKNKKWKRLWFVVKGKVLYTYKASEDMAAIESMPLLGFEVTRLTSWYQGAEPDLMFELQHQNTQPLVFLPRAATSGSAGSGSTEGGASGDRKSGVEESQVPNVKALSPYVKSSADTTTPRLIFRTDSAAATTKWLNVLREASLA